MLSIPDVSLVVIDFIFLQETPKLILEGFLPMIASVWKLQLLLASRPADPAEQRPAPALSVPDSSCLIVCQLRPEPPRSVLTAGQFWEQTY
jgi:hypothetical protein